MSNASSDPIPVAGVRCRMCGAPVVRRAGARGPSPTTCGVECRRAAERTRRRAARAARPLTQEQRSALARRAASARWSGVAPEDRTEQARAAASARWEGHEKLPPRRTRTMRACGYCGEVALMAVDQKQCGRDDCRRAHAAREMREKGWHRPHRQAERAARRAQPGAVIEKFDPRDVFERDGWVCGICGDPVDPALRWPDRMSVSLDHVVPLEMGGDHVPENARCSHLGCNTARGTGVAA